jgi:hypothetical protein
MMPITGDNHSSGGFLAHELVIPSGITISPLVSSSMSQQSRQDNHSSGGFPVYELVIPCGITIPPVDSSSMSLWFPAG